MVRNSPPRLEAVFPREEGLELNVINLSRWTELGDAASVFAEAYCIAFQGFSPASRSSAAGSMINGFVDFLRQTSLKINEPSDVPDGIGKAFVTHLKRKRDGVPVLKPNTQMNYYKVYKYIAIALHAIDPRWKRLSIVDKPFAGVRPASGNKISTGSRSADVMTAAAKQAQETMETVWPMLPKLALEISALQRGEEPTHTTEEGRLAHILSTFEGNYPLLKTIRKMDGFHAMTQVEYESLRKFAHPIGIDLVPFFLLLAMHTGFNEQPLRVLSLGGVSHIEVLGQKKTILKSSKRRAGNSAVGAPQRRAIPASNHVLAPERLINFVIAWTERIREYAIPQMKDDLFIHVISEGGKHSRRGLHVDTYAAINDNYNTRVSNLVFEFCKMRDLKYSSTRDSRLAFAELVYEVANGNALELKRLLGHKLVSTGQDSYRTSAMQQKNAELLAGAMAAQQRFVNSAGKIDSRASGENRSRTAATPGFTCADPFQSPQPGEREGRLCTSYGHCAACPLALSDENRPYALARFLQLRGSYEDARSQLGVEVWKLKFMKSYDALIKRWIPAVDSGSDREIAARIALNKLPTLE